MLIAIYVLFCIAVGYLGRKTRARFIGVTLLSLLLTPLLVFIMLFLLKPTKQQAKTA